jgi:hypothetical protein
VAAEIPGPRARQRPKAQQRRRKSERQKTSLKDLWKLTSRRSLSTRARTRCSVASRAGWKSTNKTQPVDEDQQKASAIVAHQICSLEAGERLEKDPAGTADQMQFPSASLCSLSLEVKKSHLILCQREFGDPRSRTRQILSTLSMPRTTPVAPAWSRKSRGREAKLSSRTICHAMCAAIATPPGKWHSVRDAGMTKLMRQVHATSARAFTSRCRQDVCPQG